MVLLDSAGGVTAGLFRGNIGVSTPARTRNRNCACGRRCCDACRRVGSESRNNSLLSHAYAQAPMISMQPVRQVSMTNVNGPTVTPTVVMSPVPVQPVQQIVQVYCTPCTAVFQLAACVRAECALSITKPGNKQKFRQKVLDSTSLARWARAERV